MESQTSASFVIHPKIALLLLLLIAIRSTKTHYPSMIIVDTRTSEYMDCVNQLLNKKCVRRVWPTRYARPPLMTQVQHFVSRTRRGRDKTYRRCELMTLIFDLGGHGACGWCGSSSFIRIPSMKFIGLAIWKIWRTMCVSINGAGDPDLLTLKLLCESHIR